MKRNRIVLVLICLCLSFLFVAGSASAAETEYISYEDAVEEVRQRLVNREEIITVSVRSDTELSSNACSELYDRAIAHTGVPYEGDYIRANTVGCYWETSVTVADGVYYYTFTITPNWLSTAEMEAEVDAAVDALLAELNLWNATEYEKIVGVYNWITENVQYDFDNLDDDSYLLKHSTYSALIQRNTVCQGYATLLYRLMLSLDVDCRYISGVSDGENHAWNIVRLEGKYYNVDATWDRDLMGHYRNFLCTEANFGDHVRKAEYDTAQFHSQYPMAIAPYVHNVTASGTVKAGMEWVLDGDTGTLTVSGTGAIPSYRYSDAPWYPYRESVCSIVVSEGITEVGERAFYWCTNCTSVTLPSTLYAIREYGFNNLRALQYITLPENLQIIEFCAFSECAGLKTITLPDSVHTVGPSAFSNCPGLTSATLSAGMTSIPNSMFFNDTKLRTVVIPDSITSIGSTAFSDCALRSFHIPANLTSIGTSALADNAYLQEITVAEGNPSFKSINGVLFSRDGKTLLCYPGGKYGPYTVPEGTEVIAYGAFRGVHNLTSINFGTTVRTIGNYAFSYCIGLRELTLPANVTLVEDSAFRSCTNLKSITFQNPSVTLKSGGVFAECDTLETVTLPSKITEIPGYLFYGCARLRNITIPSTARSIGSSAFLDCDSLQTIVIPGNVKSIGRQAFDYCNMLQTVILQEGVTKLEDYSIRNCPNLRRVVLPDSLTSIGKECFDLCPYASFEVNCGSYAHSYVVSRGKNYSASHPYTQADWYEPTCTEWGYYLYSCRCGLCAYEDDYMAPYGHRYSVTTVPPTCESWGYNEYSCSACGSGYEDDWVSPVGHTFGDWYEIIGPSCTDDGIRGRDCTACDYSETESIVAVGHNRINGICTVCGDDIRGKTVSILGDSISTYSGISNNAQYNQTLGSNIGFYPVNDVTTRTATWWQQVIDTMGMELCVNNSSGGGRILSDEMLSTISGGAFTSTPRNVAAYKDRCVNLHNTNGEKPDVILVFLGTNDFSYHLDPDNCEICRYLAACTVCQGTNTCRDCVAISGVSPSFCSQSLGTADIRADLITRNSDGTFAYLTPQTTCEAYAIMLHKMRQMYPDAEIFCMGLMARRDPDNPGGYHDHGQPTAFNNEMKRVVESFGATFIDLEHCGIDKDSSSFDRYIYDKAVHPNAAGMDKIAETVIRTMLGENTELYEVAADLTNVKMEGSSMAFAQTAYTATLTPTADYVGMTVSVTMGGKDITESVYSDGVISIPCVTGDVVITAVGIARESKDFRWEFNGTGLVSSGADTNKLTRLSGSVTNGMFSGTRYQLECGILLLHDRSWILEWKGEGAGGFMLALDTKTNDGNKYFFHRSNNTLEAFGYWNYDASMNYNYGVSLQNVIDTGIHTYRLENRIAADGSNMVYLTVDGEQEYRMDRFFHGGTAQNSTEDWICGQDFTFRYIGTEELPLTNYRIDYLAVWEDHTHTYEFVVTAPTCTEQGYTTYTCPTCGHSYVDTYTEALGHTPGEPLIENEGPHGSFDTVIYCETCGTELSRVHDDGYLPGDINGDGAVNNRDVTRLHRYLSGYDEEVVEAALDINGDGKINNKDLTRLFQYLSGWDVTIN